MSFKYLNLSGLEDLWINIKNYILSKVPTKTSELTNDSGYLTSHQSLDNYVTLNTSQTITAIKTITGGNQGKMLFKNPNYTKGDAVESGTTISRLYFGNGTSYATANGVLTTDIDSAGNTSMELCAMNNTASSSNRASLIITYDKSATRTKILKSWGDFIPYSNDGYTLGTSSSIWKECYSNAYYLGSTAFGDIVTHNASEFLTGHPSITLSSNTTSTASPAHGGTFTCIDSVTQDTNGHITKVNTKTVTLPSDNNTDTLMTQNVSTTNSTYPILLCPTANATSNQGAKTGIFAKSVKINPSTNVVSASGFSGNLTGNVTGNCSGSSGSCTGNAATATQFSANKSVTLTGDVTGTASSKAGWSVATTLANSGVTAGDYGPSANASPAHSGTFTVPSITVDAKGRITAASTKTITLPSDNNTDTKVTQAYSTTNNSYPVLFSATAGVTSTSSRGDTTSIVNNGIYANPSTGSLYATKLYSGGNAVLTAHPAITTNTDTTSTASPAHSGTFTCIDSVTRDSNGHVTKVNTKTITLPADNNTDTKVTQTVTTANSGYPVLLCATANATETGTTTSRFSAGLTVNTRYSAIYMTNKYDTANTKGVRNSTTGYLNGDIIFRCYDASEMGRIHCESSKNGYQQTYMQARSYIKNGAISPEGTATTCYITVRVRDNGSKTIYTDGSWEHSLTPYANNAYSLGTSSLKWKNAYTKKINNLEPSSLSLPNPSNNIDISAYFTYTGTGETNVYTVPSNGWIFLYLATISSCEAKVLDAAQNVLWGTNGYGFREMLMIPVVAGSTLQTQWTTEYPTVTVLTAKFYPCQGNI